MPEVTVKLSVLVSLDVPAEYAGEVTREDIVAMARSAIPDSLTKPDPANGLGGAVDGVQVIADDVAMEECDDNGDRPVMADVFIEHDICDEPQIEDQDEGFVKLEEEE